MRLMARQLWRMLYIATFVIPLGALWVSGSPDFRRTQILLLAGMGTIAFVFFSNQFVLTARPRFIERFFGWDKLIRWHVLAALMAMAAVFLHGSLEGHFFEESIQPDLGEAALTIFLCAVVFSLVFFPNFLFERIPWFKELRDLASRLFRLRYDRVRFLHAAMFAAVTLAFAHVMLAPIRGIVAFKIIIAIYFAGLTCFFVFHKFLRPRLMRPFEVSAALPEGPSTRTFRLVPRNGKALRYEPGQFLFIRLRGNGFSGEIHPFTISSSPSNPDCLSITVKAVGDYTERLMEAGPGQSAMIDAPFGVFTHRHLPEGRPLFFIAGGIGVTPFLSMLRFMDFRADSRRVTLLWNARTSADMPCLAELETMAKRMPNLLLIPVISGAEPEWPGRRGRIDGRTLNEFFPEGPATPKGMAETEFFVCGPPPMMQAVISILKKMGVGKARIHYERFSL